MPKVDHDTPKFLKPYIAHGVYFEKQDDTNAHAACPFCGHDGGKFAVEIATGRANCVTCQLSNRTPKGGLNVPTFLRAVWEAGRCPPLAADDLATDRGLAAETIARWGLVQSPITGDWLFPGYGPGGKLDNLYRYVALPGRKKRTLIGTTEVDHAMFGVPLFDTARPTVYVAESWNAPALDEALAEAGRADANVIGVPGANVFKAKWAPLFAGKHVVLVLDNDHPTKTGKNGAAFEGAKRTAGILAGSPTPPASISYTRWGAAGDGYDPDRSSGYDARDLLISEGGVTGLATLLSFVIPVPPEWVGGRAAENLNTKKTLEPTACDKWPTVLNAWRRAMRWTDDLEHMLATCLAIVVSTETQGQPLWAMVCAAPSSGKTTILEAIDTAGPDYIHSKSELSRVYSGFKLDKEGTEDFSIVPQIQKKTLIVMDGDAVLRDPNRAKIMAQYRGLYDGVGRSHFNNGTSRNYAGTQFTFIIGGTATLRELDAAEAGARFFYVSFKEAPDADHERAVNRMVIQRAFRNVKIIANGTPESRKDADLTTAMKLTGGYVRHLRENAADLINAVAVGDAAAEQIINYGEFVAFARARPPKGQDEVVEREFSARLVEQFGRLSVCLAAVLGKSEVDAAVVARVRRTALDTARGRGLAYMHVLASEGLLGVTTNAIETAVAETNVKVHEMLRFLKKIHVADVHRPAAKAGEDGRKRWFLTPRVAALYAEVFPSE